MQRMEETFARPHTPLVLLVQQLLLYKRQNSPNRAFAELATRLLRSSTRLQHIQEDFWSALSENLTELYFIMDPHPYKPMRLDVLTQLTNLTSLKFNMIEGMSDVEWDAAAYEPATSFVLSLPRLKSLHMRQIQADNLTLLCPELRSLTIDGLRLKGDLSLPASLEDLSIDSSWHYTFKLHEAAAVIALRGLTSLLCHVPEGVKQAFLFGILPSMSALRNLDVALCTGQLPPRLPGSLRAIRYSLVDAIYFRRAGPLSPRELQHFAGACQLPELQSISMCNSSKWTPGVLQAIEKIQAESSVDVSVEESWRAI